MLPAKTILGSLSVLATLGLAAAGPSRSAEPPDWAGHPQNEWVKQSPTADRPAPPFGWEGSGDYDPQSKLWIHHAGHDGIPQGFHLFTYDLLTRAWEQRFPPSAPPGVCCVDGANVFDVANRQFVRFPGGMLGHGYQWSRGEKLGDSAVWLYDVAANAWTNMRPAPYGKALANGSPGGLNAGATYDAANELAISFGGQGSSGGTSKLFFYDTYANRLYPRDAAGAPSQRDGMGITCDTKNDCLAVFGSQYASDEKTYLYRTRIGKWEAHDLDPHPPGKKAKTYSTIPKMAYDSLNGICLCVTRDDATGQHETWALDAGKLRWTKMNPPTEPSASMSRSRNLAYSAEHNVFILELAPQAQKGREAEIWTYRYKKVLPSKAPGPPSELQARVERDRVALTWKSTGAKVYHISRAPAAEPWKLDFVPIDRSHEPKFTDRDLKDGQEFVYTVKSDHADGPASFRAHTTPRVLVQPVVSVLAANRVQVTWNAHPAKDVAGYNVYRGLVTVRTVKKGEAKPWRDNDPEYAEPTPVEVRDITGIVKLTGKPVTVPTFLDTTVDLSKPGDESNGYRFAVHAYIVKAVNARGGESGPSPYALTIPSAPQGLLNRDKGTIAELKWTANPERGIAGYHVYKLQGTWSIVRVTDEPITTASFTHKSAGPTRYWVTAIDALGQEGQPSSPVWHQHRYDGFFKGEWHQ